MMPICSAIDELEFDYSFKVVLDRLSYVSFPEVLTDPYHRGVLSDMCLARDRC